MMQSELHLSLRNMETRDGRHPAMRTEDGDGLPLALTTKTQVRKASACSAKEVHLTQSTLTVPSNACLRAIQSQAPQVYRLPISPSTTILQILSNCSCPLDPPITWPSPRRRIDCGRGLLLVPMSASRLSHRPQMFQLPPQCLLALRNPIFAMRIMSATVLSLRHPSRRWRSSWRHSASVAAARSDPNAPLTYSSARVEPNRAPTRFEICTYFTDLRSRKSIIVVRESSLHYNCILSRCAIQLQMWFCQCGSRRRLSSCAATAIPAAV